MKNNKLKLPTVDSLQKENRKDSPRKKQKHMPIWESINNNYLLLIMAGKFNGI